MLIYKTYKQKPSDKFGVKLMRQAQKLDFVKYRKEVNFKPLYTTGLSEKHHYNKHIDFDIFNLNGTVVESISRKNEEIKYALIHLHGGAYVSNFNDTYRKVAYTYLKCINNLRVYSLIYSLAPDKPYPFALNETVELYRYLLDLGFNSTNIIIAGDSAGGGLTIASSLYLRDHSIPLPKALITMSAWTNLAMDGVSHEKNKKVDPMFGEGSVPLDIHAYVQENDIKNPYISPKYGDYTKFTNMLMFVGGNEIIESDTLDVAHKAKENNEIQVHDFKGMFHVFPFGFNMMESSRKAWQIIKEYINEKLKDDENNDWYE